MNAEIRRFKIALTSDCVQRCRYCFVDKNAGQTLPFKNIKKAVSLFLGSVGKFKKLYIYGGEPLVHFELLKKTVLFSRRMAERLKKHLAIAVSTGGTIVSAEHLSFFDHNDVNLCFSIDGDEKTHNRFRRLKNGGKTFKKTLHNVDLAFRVLGPARMGLSQGVHPQHARRMFENFRYLVSLGFENTNLEIIQGIQWPPKCKRDFERNLRLKMEFVFKRIYEDKPVFPLSVCETLASGCDLAYQMCPFHSSFELFADGFYSFYPHPFLWTKEEKERAYVGTADHGLKSGYRNCRFDPAGARCRGCTEKYYTLERFFDGSPPESRRRAARLAVIEILNRAGKEVKFKDYVQLALEKAYSGFG